MPDAAIALANIGVRGGAATALAAELAPDERPLGAVKATAEDDMTAGTLLLTDRRLVFFKRGLRKQRRESMRLADIQAVEITGMLTKKVELKIGGRTLKYDADTIMGTDLNPKGFVEAVHRAIATARGGGQPEPATAPSPPPVVTRSPTSNASSRCTSGARLPRRSSASLSARCSACRVVQHGRVAALLGLGVP